MSMMDRNTCRQHLAAAVSGLGKSSPDTVKGYAQAGRRTGHLDDRTRALGGAPPAGFSSSPVRAF